MRWIIRSLGSLVLLVVLAACSNTYSWHQKLTVVVETPTGTISGSSVVLVSALEHQRIGGKYLGHAVQLDVTGEATVIEVAPGRYLFALLKGAEEQATRTYRSELGTEGQARWGAIGTMRGARALPREAWPLFVTFANPEDPASVERVDPDDLAATFGPGISLKSITLEITDEPVTQGKVEAVLGWLETIGRDRANLVGKPENGRVSDQPDPELYMIAPSDFSSELYK